MILFSIIDYVKWLETPQHYVFEHYHVPSNGFQIQIGNRNRRAVDPRYNPHSGRYAKPADSVVADEYW
jgi:hypothetical protein